MKKCKYCKKILEDKKVSICKSCRKKYNELYYEMMTGKFMIWYYKAGKLIKVKKIGRLVSLLNDTEIKQYITENRINPKCIEIRIVDISKYDNETIRKLRRYIEIEEYSIYRRKKRITKKDAKEVQAIYNQISKEKIIYKRFKREQKLKRRRKILELKNNNYSSIKNNLK